MGYMLLPHGHNRLWESQQNTDNQAELLSEYANQVESDRELEKPGAIPRRKQRPMCEIKRAAPVYGAELKADGPRTRVRQSARS